MTLYVIVRRSDGDSEDWTDVSKVEARSSTSAIRQHVEETKDTAREYVAVPARSWKPVFVEVETKTALKFS